MLIFDLMTIKKRARLIGEHKSLFYCFGRYEDANGKE